VNIERADKLKSILMKFRKIVLPALILCLAMQVQAQVVKKTKGVKAVQPASKITTPDESLAELKNGNKRFLNGRMINTNYKKDIEETKNGQHPHAIILSCIDSRVPPEILFDQGIGHIFVARVAGEVDDEDITGSIEYATLAKGAKLIVVMAHRSCGAIDGAIHKEKLGHLTQLEKKIETSITGDSTNVNAMMEATAKKNAKATATEILKESDEIRKAVKEGKVKIVTAYYDITNGKVEFFD
jgi:carbonic anhydrase